MDINDFCKRLRNLHYLNRHTEVLEAYSSYKRSPSYKREAGTHLAISLLTLTSHLLLMKNNEAAAESASLDVAAEFGLLSEVVLEFVSPIFFPLTQGKVAKLAESIRAVDVEGLEASQLEALRVHLTNGIYYAFGDFEQIKENVGTAEEFQMVSLALLASGLVRNGQFSEARKVLARIGHIDESHILLTLGNIELLLAEFRPQEALELVRELGDLHGTGERLGNLEGACHLLACRPEAV